VYLLLIAINKMIKFEGAEREVILGYIFERKLNALDGKFIIRESMLASSQASIEYENMSQSSKLNIYKKIVDRKIVNLIYEDTYRRSLFMNFVNGSPAKRKMRIREWAYHKVKSMPYSDKESFYQKLNLKFYEESNH